MQQTLQQQNPAFTSSLAAVRQHVATGRSIRARCVLSEVMGRHRITQTALATASGVRAGSIGALYHDRTRSISLGMIGRVLYGLRELTGVTYTADDLFRVEWPGQAAPQRQG